MSYCPECETLVDLDVDEVEEGEIVSCPECGMDLEIVSTNPLELRLAEEEDEYDEDDEDEDEDDDLQYDEDEDEDYDE